MNRTKTSTATLKEGCRAVEDVIRSFSMKEKSAFLEAKEKAPYLIAKESNPRCFLVSENMNVLAAARRLASYWTMRRDVFEDRAFLPLNQTGEGALSRGDMALLSNGFLMQLPNTQTGHSVLLYDQSKSDKQAKDSNYRIIFYWLSVAAENVKSRKEGLIILSLVQNVKRVSQVKGRSMEAIMNVLPMRIQHVHAFVLNKQLRGSDDSIVSHTAKLFGCYSIEKITIYRTSSESDIINKLESDYGMKKRHLPQVIGGNWGYADTLLWLEYRTRWEWDLPPGSAVSNAASQQLDFSGVKPWYELTEDEKIERKRRMNVVHSRRKRERCREKVDVLIEHHVELLDKNAHLRSQNAELEIVLEQAKAKVARFQEQNQSASSMEAQRQLSRSLDGTLTRLESEASSLHTQLVASVLNESSLYINNRYTLNTRMTRSLPSTLAASAPTVLPSPGVLGLVHPLVQPGTDGMPRLFVGDRHDWLEDQLMHIFHHLYQQEHQARQQQILRDAQMTNVLHKVMHLLAQNQSLDASTMYASEFLLPHSL